MSPQSRTKVGVKSKSSRSKGEILAWPNDPMSGLDPLKRPVPRLTTPPLAVSIEGTAPVARPYGLKTSQFRYWTAAEALRRGADFWAARLPAGKSWEPGEVLKANLDEGVDLNAYYDRSELAFFHDRADGKTVYSGESPDILCHELGHAVLDSVRPELWDAASTEVAALHESFGDISAILSTLQLQSMRTDLLAETGGKYRSSRVSRLAEQLGWALRQGRPDAVDSDCLRNAVNSLFYRDPQELPPSAPASGLSSEPHSFSRVFTGAFFEGICMMLTGRWSSPTEENLHQVTSDAGQLLVDAVQEAPIVPDYFSQVAAHAVSAATSYDGSYSDSLKSAFVRHGVLSLEAAAAITGPHPARAREVGAGTPARTKNAGQTRLPQVALSVAEFGLGPRKLLVYSAGQAKTFQVTAASRTTAAAPPAHDEAAKHFVRFLFQRGRVQVEQKLAATAVAHPLVRKTHRLVARGDELALERLHFDCGLDSTATPGRQ